MWELILSGVEDRLRTQLGDEYDELSDESRRCLRTQAVWMQLAPYLAGQCDDSPAAGATKALELTLRERVVTPELVRSISADLRAGVLPEPTALRLRDLIGRPGSTEPCLGQCGAILQALANFHSRDALGFAASETGRYLLGLAEGAGLLDRAFLRDLRFAADIRNLSAHNAVDFRLPAKLQSRLLAPHGILAWVVRCSRPGCPTPAAKP
jgi:hypothetical protein